MKFQKLGKINPNPKIEVKPKELFVDGDVFIRLDSLLGYLLDEDPGIQREFVQKLAQKMETSLQAPVEKYVLDSSLVDEFSNLREQLELVELHSNFFTQLLQISAKQAQEATAIEVPARNYIRSFLVPRYYQALALSEIVGKEKAVNLFQEFIDQFILSLGSSAKFDDLQALRASHIKHGQENIEDGWVVTFSDIEDGRFVFRNDNCLWIEALDDLKDKELLYVICCHGDFQNMKMRNEHFRLTRHYTIAEGDPYCDKMFHDVRIDKGLVHPPKEFFDGIVLTE